MSKKRRKTGPTPRGGAASRRPDRPPGDDGKGPAGQAVPPAFRRPDVPRVDVGRSKAAGSPAPRRAAPGPVRPAPPAAVRPEPGRKPAQPAPRVLSPDVTAPEARLSPSQRLARLELGCLDSTLAEYEPQVVAASYSFDPRDLPSATPVAIGFVGTRIGSSGKGPDRFERVERVDPLGGRAGRVTVTARVPGRPAGRWRVVAGPVAESQSVGLPVTQSEVSTRFGALAQGPGVWVLAWPVLVAFGAVVALVTQALLLARSGLPVAPVLALGLLACLTGYVGGKLWFLAQHRRPLREFVTAGAGIQGFLLVAVGVLAGGLAVLDLPLGGVLDATAPGVFLGMAVGRPGCFLTGCCVGRPTTSLWGLRSSDRRLVVRRLPVQLFEAAVGLVVGVAGVAITVAGPPLAEGSIFAASVAAWTLVRQFLFSLRADPHTRVGRWVTAAVCVAVIAGVVILEVAR